MKTNRTIRRRLPMLALPLALAAALPAFAQSSATVSISLSPDQPRAQPIPEDFLGISLETSSIMAANNGGRPWLSGAATPYSRMLQKIGVKNLRIGGNSAERQPYASVQDGANVDAFAQLIGANLIWTVPVKQFYDQNAGVAYVQSLYNDRVAHGYTFPWSVEIGNEPDNNEELPGSAIDYATWQARYDSYNSALRHQVNGSIQSTGPSVSGGANWPNGLSEDAKYSGTLHASVGFVTLHNYPEGSSKQYATVADADAALLSAANAGKYQNLYDSFGATAVAHGFKPRLEETNSMYGGGSPGASNSYAAALWVEDYLCYMAYRTGMAGMNIHTGPVGSNTGSYNPISPVGAADAYDLQGPGYGMWAFHYGSQGRPVPTAIGNPANANVTAYGLLEDNGTESVHIINKSFGADAVDLTVKITPNGRYANAQVIYLKQANNDVTATGGITFGGQPMSRDGTWSGGYGPAFGGSNGVFTVSLPHAQAAVVHFF